MDIAVLQLQMKSVTAAIEHELVNGLKRKAVTGNYYRAKQNCGFSLQENYTD
jgi:hypothetical protein